MLPQTLSYTRTAIASIGINTSVASLCSKSSSRSLLPFIYGVSIIRKPAQEQYRKATHMSIRPSSTSNRLSPVATLISRPVTPSRNLATSATPSTSTSTSTHKQQSSSSQPLTWNTYLSLRQKRRYYNLTSSIVTGLGTFTGGVSFLMTQDLEKLSGILFGLDPAMALGLGGMVFGTAGWLVGPFAGEAMFRLAHRRVIAQMEVVSTSFLIHFFNL